MNLTALILLLAMSQQPAPPPTQAAATPAKDALEIQVALDRAGFSPGVLDGRSGSNTKKAIDAYRKVNGSEPAAIQATATYQITEADAAAPLEPQIPSDLMEQSKLKTLGYRTLLEALSERFHATPALMQRLNPGATFAAGAEITVPNVEPMQLPINPPKTDDQPSATEKEAEAQAALQAVKEKPAVTVTVTESTSALTVTDAGGNIIMYAPVTTGSEHDPLPIGEWKVNGVGLNPTFRYNPDLFWDANPTHQKAVIPAGPNNPVGLVWIDLSKDHYGIHGTPEPANISRSQSHGCVRLTNWDALRLAALVKPGTRVVFQR